MSTPISQEAASAQKDIQAAATEVTSFFNSAAFHNHIRSWTFVILAIFVMGFLYVHESNSNAANTAVAVQIDKSTKQTQESLDKQIAVIRDDSKAQVQVLQQQQTQIQTVAQAVGAIRNSGPANMPPIIVNPIVTQPATPTQPEKTTASLPAAGDTPVATITGDGLKQIAENSLACKQTQVELQACTQTSDLKDQKLAASEKEVTELKKVKLEPAWKKALARGRDIAIGLLVGAAIKGAI